MFRTRVAIGLTLLGLFLVLGSIVTVAVLDRALTRRQSLTFTASTGDTLVGTYYPGTQPAGVILLEGFGSDQVTMTSLASLFARSGWHVFVFDFSGHGRSPGTLTFDNAQTDRLAHQALSALEEFTRISGLRAGQILVVGHSLGARVALQSATMNPQPAAGLALLGAQVNLTQNVQAEFFTGTSDSDLPWVQGLGAANPPVPILMVSGEWDDILTPENARLLFQQLGGGEEGINRTLVILPTLVHNYEPFSARVQGEIITWIHAGRATGNGSGVNEPLAGLIQTTTPAVVRVYAWIFGLAGMLLLVISADRWLSMTGEQAHEPLTLAVIEIRRFLWGKLLLWLGALPIAALLGSLFFLIPLGKPVFNLIYVGFIGGYGLLMLVLYWRGKVPGVRGKLPFVTEQKPMDGKRILVVTGLLAGMLILTAAYARTGWSYVFPLNVRLAWLFIFTPFTALGFWIGLHEAQMLPRRGSLQLALALIGLFPFFLYTLLMAVLGSLSGMIGGLQGLLVLWLVLAFGSLVQTTGRRPWLSAACMAFLLYWLLLPQGVLF